MSTAAGACTSASLLAGVVGFVGAYMVGSSSSPVHWASAGVGFASVAYIVSSIFCKQSTAPVALHPEEWRQFELVKKEQISHNTAIYRFKLPSPTMQLGLPIGQHVSIKATISGKDILRSYTPVSGSFEPGAFELLIKTYEQGNLSRHFAGLEVGDFITAKGPKGQFKYTPNMVRAIGMIAGGTGITPMLQVIRAILENPADRTQVSLIFANVNADDILLKEKLDLLAEKHATQFNVYYVLNNPPKDWAGGVGFVSKDMIAQHLPAPAEDVKVLLCGPPPMVKAMSDHLEALSFAKPQTISKAGDQVFKF